MSQKWYSRESDIPDFYDVFEQGDIFFDVPLNILNIKEKTTLQMIKDGKIGIKQYNKDVILLTQSCDLENSKVASIIISPLRKLSDLLKPISDERQDDFFKELKNGGIHRLHLLNKIVDTKYADEFPVVDFGAIFSYQFTFLNKISSLKIRQLNSPYREHLSQSFAKFFMRVGLPTPID